MPKPIPRSTLALSCALLIFLLTASPQHLGAAQLTRISGQSPFAEQCNHPVAEGQTGERSYGAEVEISLAVDPSNPDRMVSAWIQDAYAGIVAVATQDGGRTWTPPAVVPGLNICSGDATFMLTADPWLSIGPDGTVYLASMSWGDRGFHTHVTTSEDGGMTWSAPVPVMLGEGASHDKPAVTADPDEPCVAHAIWQEMATLMGGDAGLAYAKTVDCGRTWELPVVVNVTGPGDGDPTVPAAAYAPEVLVAPDGTLTAIWFDSPLLEDDEVPHWIRTARSTDGGATWSAPQTAVEYVPGNQATDPETGAEIKTHYPWPSADVGPDGTMFIAYHHQDASGAESIQVIRSEDAGQTWGAPVAVTRARRTPQPFLPSIAVAGDGTIGMTYYDMRADALGDADLTTDVFFSVSRDGGDTWRERHIAGPFDMRQAMNKLAPSVGLWVGDYHGLDGLPKGFAATFGMSAPMAVHGANDVFFTTIQTGDAGSGGEHVERHHRVRR